MLTLKSLICRVLRYLNCFGFCSFYFNLVWLSPFCMVGLWDQGFLVGIRVFPPESHVSVKK